jgi:hypothetical protein|tara:strand:- start:136 stop:378 length:243 start_codon:yes stop_codon:yes gene_type:complete
MITIEQVKKLNYQDTIHHNDLKNADGTCQRWRINGQLKTWKRTPNRFKLPVKHGLYAYDYITQETADIVHLPGEMEGCSE